jgi:hypothetical protein
MLHAGLDLSSRKVDVCLLSRQGESSVGVAERARAGQRSCYRTGSVAKTLRLGTPMTQDSQPGYLPHARWPGGRDSDRWRSSRLTAFGGVAKWDQ